MRILGAKINSKWCQGVLCCSGFIVCVTFCPFASTNRAPWDLVAPLDLQENPEMM